MFQQLHKSLGTSLENWAFHLSGDTKRLFLSYSNSN